MEAYRIAKKIKLQNPGFSNNDCAQLALNSLTPKKNGNV